MNLHFDAQGQKKSTPLVFIHAFPLDRHMWKHQLSGLSDQYYVIAPDLPGFGESPALRDDASMSAYVKFLEDFMAREKINKAVFAGCSMGGYILFEYWRQHPEEFAGLILCDTRAEADTPETREKRMNTIDQVREIGTEPLADNMIPNLLCQHTRETQPDLVDTVKNTIINNSPVGIIHALQAMAAREDSTDTLPLINVPTLILVGEEDALTPPDIAKSMHEAMPHSMLEIIPNAGHLSPLENPEPVNKAIKKIIKQNI